MATRERRPVVPAAPVAGEVVGTVVSAELGMSTSLNEMVVWTFDTPGGTVKRWCVRFGQGAVDLHETAQALGLGKSFRLSDAVGRSCKITLAQDGQFLRITRARPL